jgi:hypothetical protein
MRSCMGMAERPWQTWGGGAGYYACTIPRGQGMLTPGTVYAQYPGLASAAPGQHGAGKQSWPRPFGSHSLGPSS